MRWPPWFLAGLALHALAAGWVAPRCASADGEVDLGVTICAAAEQEVAATVAYNSAHQEYLVVWYNDRAGCDDIRAQRVAVDGSLLGSPFYISAGCTADRRYPDVAYDSTADQYLVVWEEHDAAVGYSIRGRRVSGAGEVLGSSDIEVRAPGYAVYSPGKPAVSYAFTSDRYLVVWSETLDPIPVSYSINGQVVTGSGTLDGDMFTISEGDHARDEPDVAYNRHANRYLVVWQLDSGTLFDVHGQQVHGGGGLYQGDITIAYYTKSCMVPAVAAIPTTPNDNKFLVAWEMQYAPGDRDIYARLVAEDGTPGDAFWISWANGVDESAPAVDGSESTLQFFVAWRHPEGVGDVPIKGRSATATATIGNVVPVYPAHAADHPAVSWGPNHQVLAAWEELPSGESDTDIYGHVGSGTNLVFADDFETGNAVAWSSAVP